MGFDRNDAEDSLPTRDAVRRATEALMKIRMRLAELADADSDDAWRERRSLFERALALEFVVADDARLRMRAAAELGKTRRWHSSRGQDQPEAEEDLSWLEDIKDD